MAAATALGSGVVLLDIMAFRPLCSATGSQAGCVSLTGDALGVFSMARLFSWGKGLINPFTYELAGGYEAPFVGKPPAVVSYLGAVLWLSERPLVLQLLIVGAVAMIVGFLIRGSVAQPARRVVEVAGPVLLVISALAGNPVVLARVASSAMALVAIPVVALLARRLVDERTGVVAAVLMAVTPAIWVGASMMSVETLYVVALPLMLLAALRVSDRPGALRYAQLGGALLLLSFTRLEGAAFVPLILGGLAISHRRTQGVGRQVMLSGLALVIVAAPLAGWSAFNGTRQHRNVGVSPGGGSVLWSGACDEVAYGRLKGFWMLCKPEMVVTERIPLVEAVDHVIGIDGYAETVFDPDNEVLAQALELPERSSVTSLASVDNARSEYGKLAGTLPDGRLGVGVRVDDRPVADTSLMLEPGQRLTVDPNPISGFSEVELDLGATKRSLRYYGERLDDLPLLGAARVGRALNVFRPAQTSQLEEFMEGRELWQAWGAVVIWWAMVPLALFGAARLRSKRPLWLFGTVAVVVVAVIAVSLGIPRYRLALDVVACVLTAVALAGWLSKRWPAAFRRLGLSPAGWPLNPDEAAADATEDDVRVPAHQRGTELSEAPN